MPNRIQHLGLASSVLWLSSSLLSAQQPLRVSPDITTSLGGVTVADQALAEDDLMRSRLR